MASAAVGAIGAAMSAETITASLGSQPVHYTQKYQETFAIQNRALSKWDDYHYAFAVYVLLYMYVGRWCSGGWSQ